VTASKKIRILFVCLGNICRSPAAEGAFRKLLQDKALVDLFEVDSCGIAGYHIGALPDPRTRKAAEQAGIRLEHRARKWERGDFAKFDFVFAMDQSNYDFLLGQAETEEERSRIFLFAPLADPLLREVPDPYYGEESDFQYVQSLVERASLGLLEKLQKERKMP